MGTYRVAVDTGGTFSDFACLDEDTGAISITKVASTPDDPSRAILQGIERLQQQGIRPHDFGFFCHGTTVGTNALLEGKGARTGLLVTEGFRGIYEVGEQARPYGPAIFDVMYDRPAMLVPRRLTGEVRERVDFRGEVLCPLDEPLLRATVRDLAAQGVESIAVCLLFSFLQPQHERRIRAVVAQEHPDCSVSLSCEILPQIREYYRLSTTVINAYLQPMLARYMARLDGRLAQAGIATAQKYVMQSNGGMATFADAAHTSVTTVLSGPAGGVTAAVAIARAGGFADLITFDMGGTSCDVALIRNGEPALVNRGKVEGHDLAVPMMDINTVSAGGGTIAQVDRLGELVVGPQSAGAVPGPACRGGNLPTVTDCNLVLGCLSADNFLGGRVPLDVGRAHGAVRDLIATPLGMSVAQAAAGVIRIIDVKMGEAIKAISTMRGHDLRDFMLLAYGGAGPLHAGRIARDLGLAGVIVPPHPGVFSAIGLLMSDVKHDDVQSRVTAVADLSVDAVAAIFAAMEHRAVAQLRRDGFDDTRIRLDRALDMRYAGEGYEITVACPAPALLDGGVAGVRRSFDAAHHAMFGHMAPDEPVEVVSYRLRSTGKVAPPPLPRFAPRGIRLADALRGHRDVHFDGEPVACPVYQRALLDIGLVLDGPAILDQFDTTTVVCPGQTATVDGYGNLIIRERAP